jgi:hypothetical protein
MDRNWAVVHLDTVNHPGGESVAEGDRSLAIFTGNDEIPVSRLNFWHGDLSRSVTGGRVMIGSFGLLAF